MSLNNQESENPEKEKRKKKEKEEEVKKDISQLLFSQTPHRAKAENKTGPISRKERAST